MSEPQQLPVPRLENWRALYRPGARAVCIKDDPPMRGFGRALKTGDVVDVRSVCWEGFYSIAVEKECAFYQLEDYFEVAPPEETTPSPSP